MSKNCCNFAPENESKAKVSSLTHFAEAEFGDVNVLMLNSTDTIMAEKSNTKMALIENDLTADDKAAQEKARTKRPPLHFLDMGLHKGDVLVYKPDENVTCSIIDQKHVLYKGEVTALSDCPVTRFARTASTAIHLTP